MILEWGKAYRLSLAPAARRTAAILEVCPMQMVVTSGLIYCMVS